MGAGGSDGGGSRAVLLVLEGWLGDLWGLRLDDTSRESLAPLAGKGILDSILPEPETLLGAAPDVGGTEGGTVGAIDAGVGVGKPAV